MKLPIGIYLIAAIYAFSCLYSINTAAISETNGIKFIWLLVCGGGIAAGLLYRKAWAWYVAFVLGWVGFAMTLISVLIMLASVTVSWLVLVLLIGVSICFSYISYLIPTYLNKPVIKAIYIQPNKQSQQDSPEGSPLL